MNTLMLYEDTQFSEDQLAEGTPSWNHLRLLLLFLRNLARKEVATWNGGEELGRSDGRLDRKRWIPRKED